VRALRDANGNLVTDDRQHADMLNSCLVVVMMVMCQLCRHMFKRNIPCAI